MPPYEVSRIRPPFQFKRFRQSRIVAVINHSAFMLALRRKFLSSMQPLGQQFLRWGAGAASRVCAILLLTW
jgi:hypothetical protein